MDWLKNSGIGTLSRKKNRGKDKSKNKKQRSPCPGYEDKANITPNSEQDSAANLTKLIHLVRLVSRMPRGFFGPLVMCDVLLGCDSGVYIHIYIYMQVDVGLHATGRSSAPSVDCLRRVRRSREDVHCLVDSLPAMPPQPSSSTEQGRTRRGCQQHTRNCVWLDGAVGSVGSQGMSLRCKSNEQQQRQQQCDVGQPLPGKASPQLI